MNCAVVTIGGSKKLAKRNLSGPDMFVANIGNGCSTPAGTDIVFPDPGPDIQYGGNAANRAAPIGNCGKVVYTPPPPNTGGNNGNTGNLPPKAVSTDVPQESPNYAFPFTTLHTLPEPTHDTPKVESPSATSIYRNIPPVITNIGGNNQGGTNTPINNGNDVSNPTNTNTSPTGKPKEGLVGGNEGLSRDCAYWKSQGYICSGAMRSLGLGFEDLWWRMVPVVVAGVFW